MTIDGLKTVLLGSTLAFAALGCFGSNSGESRDGGIDDASQDAPSDVQADVVRAPVASCADGLAHRESGVCTRNFFLRSGNPMLFRKPNVRR